MAETEVTRRRYDYRDADSRPAAVSRGLTSFIFSTVMFTATYFLLVKLWGNSTGKLHPSVYLVKSTKRLPKLAQYETVKCTGEGETRETEAHCRTDHSSTIGHYNTCAVVGNSGVLLGSHCGNEIDSKDYVIRMGIPVSKLKNRTQDVYESRLRNIDGTTLVVHESTRRKFIRVARKYRVTFSLYSIKGRLKRGINPLASRIAHKKMGGPPTTGMITALMTTTFCERPYLYGFFPFQRDARNTPIPYHYYPGDFIKPIVQNKGGHHHMGREYDFLRDLHKQGVLKMQVGPCGEN
ncbi:hypothetical protein Bbelb_090120 [Branchiostoma belcheri]|nr:hypothetical protein Bbelb_090120 [Branchiostoma belcheri]